MLAGRNVPPQAVDLALADYRDVFGAAREDQRVVLVVLVDAPLRSGNERIRLGVETRALGKVERDAALELEKRDRIVATLYVDRSPAGGGDPVDRTLQFARPAWLRDDRRSAKLRLRRH